MKAPTNRKPADSRWVTVDAAPVPRRWPATTPTNAPVNAPRAGDRR